MKMMKSCLLVALCLGMSGLAMAAPPATQPPTAAPAAKSDDNSKPSPTGVPPSAVERWARRCQHVRTPERTLWPQGTLLWGMRRKATEDDMSSMLVSVDLARVQRDGEAMTGVRIEGGRLVAGQAPQTASERAPGTPEGLVGAVFQGQASDGQQVEVALCEAESAAEDPEMVWYRLEVWNEGKQAWENPCTTTAKMPKPRALAVRGVWDATGAHREAPGKFTFACEGGAIVKCIGWGYRPWQTQGGQSLADYHQACTRMARADYCGDGQSHTREGTTIDMYDRAGVQARTLTVGPGWDPARGSFEAGWTPDGAYCLAHTRDGRALKEVMEECPGRWVTGKEEDLGEGDRCMVRQKGKKAAAVLLRNQSYGTARTGVKQE